MHSSQQFFLLLFIIIIPKISYQNLVNLGRFYECDHGLKGEVFIKNEREIIVKGFHYDGKAPLAWFHSMKKCTKGGVHSEIETFLNLPNPDGNCDVLFGTPFVNQEITLILPVSVKGMRTFGMFSYNCSNLGHVNISFDSLKGVPPAPPTLKGVTLCTLPNYPACPIGTKNGLDGCAEVKTKSMKLTSSGIGIGQAFGEARMVALLLVVFLLFYLSDST